MQAASENGFLYKMVNRMDTADICSSFLCSQQNVLYCGVETHVDEEMSCLVVAHFAIFFNVTDQNKIIIKISNLTTSPSASGSYD